MRQLIFPSVNDRGLAAVFGCCGSLAVREYQAAWAYLVQALTEAASAEEAAWCLDGFLAAAVPEEGDPHPQRAICSNLEVDDAFQGGYTVELLTPGGVRFTVGARRGADFGLYRAEVDFGRDSRSLATAMLAALAIGCGAAHLPVMVDGRPAVPCSRALAVELLRASGDELAAAILCDQAQENV